MTRMATDLSELSAGSTHKMSTLPPELLFNIFSFLPFPDLKKALLVCRSIESTSYIWHVIEIVWQILPVQAVEAGG